MDINKIKYLPKTNAFGDVYAKATGMPFVGEMMVAAAGNGGQKEQFQLTVKVVKISEYTFEMDVTSNMPAPVENASIFIFDEPFLDGCIGDYASAFSGDFVPSSEDPTVWYSDDYYCDGSGIGDECGFTYVAQADWIDGSVYVENTEQTYDHAISGTWTFEDQTI